MADHEARIDLGIAGLGPAEHIGRGGFADVYRAEQLSLRRTVAVKVLRAQGSDPEAEARFERECHAIGAVSDHPHIVGVHEGGFTRNGRAYLVMEYLPGGSLYDRINEYGPMSVSEVVDTGIKIGKALAVAHRTGVLHRDVKPANIMISAYGEPALGDFGIARIEGGHQTATGLVTASFAHAAPEVLEGQSPTAGADIYSLGTTIFELLTGRPPYFDPGDESIWPLMKRILSEPMPSPESVGMSPRLGAVFTRATARDVSERYHDAEDLVEDLSLLASDPLSLTRYPPAGDGFAPPTNLDPGGGPPPEPRSGTGSRTLVGGLPLEGVLPPVKPDLTSVHRTSGQRGEEQVVAVPHPAHRDGRRTPADTEVMVTAAVGLPSEQPEAPVAPAATTMDVPPRPQPTEPTGGVSPSTVAAIVVGMIALLAVVAGALFLSNRGNDEGDLGPVAGVAELRPSVLDESGQVVDGPLQAERSYTVTVTDAPADATFRLVVDGQPVGQAGPGPVPYRASAGHHTVALEVTTGAGSTVGEAVSVYGLGATPAAGYRANLASIDIERQGWDAAMDVFERLKADGHADLELMDTTGFPTLTPGYWTLYVPGFGADAGAAEAYCERFDLEIPTGCYAGFLDPPAS